MPCAGFEAIADSGGGSADMHGQRYSRRQGRGVPTVMAPGTIDGSGADWLARYLLESAALGHAKVVVDVSSTPFSDPEGLRLLVRAHEQAASEGRRRGLDIPSVIVRRAPGIFWLSELARKLAEG
jgi:anti-anti-sigma regulatory factor